MASRRGGSSATVTLPGPTVDGTQARPQPTRAPVVVPTRGRRRPGLLVTGVMLAALGGLIAVWLVNQAGHRTSVLVVARPVAAGATLSDSDLARAEISFDSTVGTVPAGQESQIVGRIAAADLVPGQLLAPGSVTDAGPPGPGQVLVVLSLPASRMPASGLRTGDHLLVVDTPAADAEPPTMPPGTIPATVVRVGAPDLNGVTAVDVTAATGDGPSLAARAATGRIAVIVQPRGQG
jgi:hypothetical protein